MSIFGSDGRAQITVDTLGFLANTLRGYEATSILREQLQNADDACHKQQRPGELRLEFLSDRLVVTNPSVFNDEDWARVVKPSSRGKFTDAEQTGEFGIGFWGSLHLTDTPIISSGTRCVTLHPEAADVTSKEVPEIEGTRFDFPYRRMRTEIGDQLDVSVINADTELRMISVFVGQMAELLLFTRAIEAITLVLQDGTPLHAHRTIQPIADSVDLLTVEVEGAPGKNCRYLVVRTEVADPPPNRNGRVAVALPVVAANPHGLVFVTFPTETRTALNLSINAHFRATDDRRSLENAGEHGEWNARIFEAGGDAVGSVLETLLDETKTGVPYETAMNWFADDDLGDGEIRERADRFMDAVDRRARASAVAPDTSGFLRRAQDLANLDPSIERILGKHVGDSLQPGQSVAALKVLRRWGLRRWGSAEVAEWLAANVPTTPTRRADSPSYLQDLDDAIELIDYCADDARVLAGNALIRAEHEDVYYPVRGAEISRRTHEIGDLADGLELPVAQSRFANTALGRKAAPTDAAWLHRALLQSKHLLEGKRVPMKSMGVARDQLNVQQALKLLRRAGQSLDGVPLALDESSVLQHFSDQTVRGIPDGPGRKTTSKLCRRIGLVPLHPKIDDPVLEGEIEAFGLSLILDRLDYCKDWDPIQDSRLLVEVLEQLAREHEPSPVLVTKLRERPMWAALDGEARPLTALRLPSRTFRGTSTVPLLHLELVGELELSAPIYATLNVLLQVEVLDGAEELVMECEAPSADTDERTLLLELLGDIERFTPSQEARLKKATFVLCRDGALRLPSQVLLTDDLLPLSLGDRQVIAVGLERRTAKHLEALGARRRPSPDDLTFVAREITEVDVTQQPDPGLMLWNYLQFQYRDYSEADLQPLSEVAWLVSNPGPHRRAPKDCLDPRFSFASFFYPVPSGVASPSAEMRQKLRMKGSLDADDYVRLGEHAAEHDVRLEAGFFRNANLSAVEDSPFEAAIGKLRSLPIIPLSSGGHAPERLVSRREAQIWRHLRELAPDSFATDFTNLARTWGMSDEHDIDWRLHLDVLEEIATLSAPDEDDLALARDRLDSLAEADLGSHELDTVRRRAILATSMGPRHADGCVRGDLPPATLDRLRPYIPIVEEWDRVSPLLDALELPGVGSRVQLKAVYEGPKADHRWQSLLGMHHRNLLRFLKASVSHLDDELMARWPPSVVAVERLSIRATIDSELAEQWEAEAHLELANGLLTLLVRSADVDHRAIVDAISVQFNIDQTRKSLLLSVLQSADEAKGADDLDWANVPRLSSTEMPRIHVHVETEVEFADEDAPSPPIVDRDVLPVDATRNDETEPAQPLEVAEEPSGRLAGTDDDWSHGGDPQLEQDQAVGANLPSASGPPESEAGDFSSYDADERAQSPRGVTDPSFLESEGIKTTYDLDNEVRETEYRPDDPDEEPGDEVRLCLSYYDVLRGQLPIDNRKLRRLTSGVDLERIVMFGDEYVARQISPRSVEIEDGPMLFAERMIVPGTIIRAYPSTQGAIEVLLRPDPHRVSGVWMLELDDKGALVRIREDDLELQWETDDGFYKAERRLEDIEALMKDGGKSAIQLIIEVFKQRSGAGLTTEEVWGLVAVNRLFAKATISSHLFQQSGLFEQKNGLWYMVGSELRRQRNSNPPPHSTTPGTTTRAEKNQSHEVLRLARKLAKLVDLADGDTLRRVRDVLDRSRLHPDQ